MRLKVTDVNFTNKLEWIFKLSNSDGKDFYIMDGIFYKRNGLMSPVTRKEIDQLDKGQWISAVVQLIHGQEVVTSIEY